jgi:hypothetical protein
MQTRSPFLALSLVTLVLAGCDVGDQACTDDFNYKDTDDRCPYGPPGGPQLQEIGRECPLIVFRSPGDPECANATFKGDVFPRMQATDGGRCSLSSCHGTEAAASAAFGVLLTEDPNQFYDALTSYKDPAGDPYIEENNERAWMHCNVAQLPGGRSAMPKQSGLASQADIDLVNLWMACGMKNDGVDGGGGAGAAGGAGGLGGAGGAGGAGGGL